MNGLNLKKVAAVTAGVALVAASVTAAAVNWNALADSTAHTMNVNGIVYGDSAALSDAEAAANLAGKLATLATYNVPTEVTKDVETCTTTPGTDVTAKKKVVGSALNTSKTGTDNFLNTALLAKGANVGTDILADESSLSYKVGGSTYTTSAREQIALGAEAIFDARYQVGDMGLSYDAGDFTYTATYGDLNFAKDTSGYASNAWTDGTNDKVIVPFLGKNYMVYSINDSTDQVVLVNESAVKSYTVGDKISGLKGKDGKDYYATIDGVVYSTTPDTARLTLVDATTGQLVTDYSNIKVSENETFAEDFLSTGVDIHTVDNEGTADVPKYVIEILIGSDKLTLKNGEGFPYDSTKTKISEYQWKSTVTAANGSLSSIVIENTTKNDRSYTDKDMMKPGEVAWMFNDVLGVRFDGLELLEYGDYVSTTKEVTPLVFTDALENSDNMPGVKYYGTDDALHELPYYYQLSLDTAADSNYAATFTLDGQDKIIKIDELADGNYSIYTGTGNDIDGTYTIAVTGVTDWNYVTSDVASGKAIKFTNSGDLDANYVAGYDSTNNTLYLFLKGGVNYKLKTSSATYGSFQLVGTDESWSSSYSETGAYFIPHTEGDADQLSAITYVDNQISVAKFKVDQDSTTAGSGEFVMYLNTETFKGPKVGEGGSTNDIPTGSQIDYSTGTIYIKDGKDTGISWAYDPFGTKFGVDTDGFPYFNIPEAQAYPEAHFVVRAGEGTQTCTTAPTTTTETVATPYTGFAVTPIKASEASATGKYIVVGGYMVNSLFPNPEGLVALGVTEPLAAEGDKVTAAAEGNVYVAGYTAGDTTDAVNALIALLESSKP